MCKMYRSMPKKSDSQTHRPDGGGGDIIRQIFPSLPFPHTLPSDLEMQTLAEDSDTAYIREVLTSWSGVHSPAQKREPQLQPFKCEAHTNTQNKL